MIRNRPEIELLSSCNIISNFKSYILYISFQEARPKTFELIPLDSNRVKRGNQLWPLAVVSKMLQGRTDFNTLPRMIRTFLQQKKDCT